MLNDEQIARIDAEIGRLEDKKTEIRGNPNFSAVLKIAVEDFCNGEIDALKWTKENL
jgi:hypothetical protein